MYVIPLAAVLALVAGFLALVRYAHPARWWAITALPVPGPLRRGWYQVTVTITADTSEFQAALGRVRDGMGIVTQAFAPIGVTMAEAAQAFIRLGEALRPLLCQECQGAGVIPRRVVGQSAVLGRLRYAPAHTCNACGGSGFPIHANCRCHPNPVR